LKATPQSANGAPVVVPPDGQQRAKDDGGESAVRAALARDGGDAALWSQLGRLLRAEPTTDARRKEALACYRQAVQCADGAPQAWFNLANLQYELQQTEPALESVQAALHRAPDLGEARLLRARCLTRLERLEAAREAYADLLRLDATQFSAWLELGNVCRKLGHAERAVQCYERAASCRPDDARAHLACARALGAMGSHERAALHYHRAVVATGDRAEGLADLHHRMGRFRLDDGDVPRALESLRQAGLAAALAGARIDPQAVAEIDIDLGDALLRLGLPDEARAVLQRAAGARSEATLVRLAQTAFRFNEWQIALEVLRRNVGLHPDSALAEYNLAHMLAECSMLQDAITHLDRAESLADEPLAGAVSLRGAIAGKSGDAEHARDLYRQLADGPQADRMRSSAAMSSLYSDTMTPMQVAEFHRELFAPLGRGARARSSFSPARMTGRPLRVGLVTADFHHQHPVNIFFQPLLQRWDRARMPIACYFVGTSHDDQTRLARSRCDLWREMTHASAAQFARRVEDDGIDVLIDLAGHTGHQRIALFAQRLAPVQVTFLGYPGSTGCPNIDWIIGDEVVTPPSHDALCSERVWRLPHAVFCYAPHDAYPPAELGEQALQRPLTFASFNNVAKLTPRSVRLWAQVLLAVPGARLLLKSPSFGDAVAQRRYIEQFAQAGVSADRLLFRGASPLPDMMQEYADVDIALDPVPYNGGTTTLQAMWMGVPAVVLAGGHFVSRMGASFMSAAGLPQWIARDDAHYVEIARDMAADRAGLLALKRGLRQRLLSRPAWDIDTYARDFMAALQGMWQQWCDEAA
jgi:predicted O-linked N-acetylglucosamine transferase (SPINDLY family)